MGSREEKSGNIMKYIREAKSGGVCWGRSFNELRAYVREEIPTTAVVFNNGQWGAEKKNQVIS